MVARAPPRSLAAVAGCVGSMFGNPALDVRGFPDPAGGEVGNGLGERRVLRKLAHPLPADPESFSDLGGAHEVMHDSRVLDGCL